MLPYVLLVLALLLGAYLLGKWFMTADPQGVLKALKWVFPVIALVLFITLVYVRRFELLFWLATVLLPLWGLFKLGRNRAKAMRGATAGQQSEVSTSYLRMVLDHDSGEMSGMVIKGNFQGRNLEDMTLEELARLWQECKADDAQSAAVLEAYLDRTEGDAWRKAAGASEAEGASRAGSGPSEMSLKEAYAIMGLEEGAQEKDILDAHRRLMQKVHPDHGGSNYLASKINAAKDLLLARVRGKG